MLYNKKHKFIYLHIPKAAGTFVSTVLRQNVEGTYDNVFQPHNDFKMPDWHFGIEGIVNYVPDISDYKVFTTIRNPFDWYVSLYEYTKNNNAHEWRIFKPGDHSFKAWLRNIINCKYFDERPFTNDKTSTGTYYKQLRDNDIKVGWLTYRFIRMTSQWNSLDELNFDGSKSILHKAIKVENLSTELPDYLINELGIDKRTVNKFNFGKKINATGGRRPYKEYYDKEDIELVQKKDKYLLEQFNYTYE